MIDRSPNNTPQSAFLLLGHELEQQLKPANFIIRQATITDLPDICAVDDEAFSPYGTAEAPDVFAKRLIAFPTGCIVLTVDGETLGYGCAEKWAAEREPQLGEDPFDTHDPAGRVFCITGMAVRAAHRGRGYGRALVERMLDIARRERCEKVVLETTHAAGLYEKFGFTVTGFRRQGDVRLAVMGLALTPPAPDRSKQGGAHGRRR